MFTFIVSLAIDSIVTWTDNYPIHSQQQHWEKGGLSYQIEQGKNHGQEEWTFEQDSLRKRWVRANLDAGPCSDCVKSKVSMKAVLRTRAVMKMSLKQKKEQVKAPRLRPESEHLLSWLSNSDGPGHRAQSEVKGWCRKPSTYIIYSQAKWIYKHLKLPKELSS